MDVVEAIKARRSIRAFKPDPVPQSLLQEIVDAARWAPSWENVQPWELTIVGGEKMEELKRALTAAADEESQPEIPRPNFTEPYLSRRRSLGYKLVFDVLQIAREDMERRRWWRLQGLNMFHAPNAIFISADRSINEWAIFDVGMVAQTLMVAAVNYGLGTIVQVAPVSYPQIVKQVTGIPDSKLLIIAIAIGYPDWSQPVNQFDREREPVEKIVSWCGFK